MDEPTAPILIRYFQNITLLQIRALEHFTAALDRAADKRGTSRSDYIRAAVLDRIRADGIEIDHLAGASVMAEVDTSIYKNAVSQNKTDNTRSKRFS